MPRGHQSRREREHRQPPASNTPDWPHNPPASGSFQQSSDFLRPSDCRGEYPASEYSDTQSTQETSVFSSGEDEATRYSGRPSDGASLAPPLRLDAVQPVLGASFDEELFDETSRSVDAEQPFTGHDTGVATVEPSWLYLGSHFPNTSYLDVTDQSIHGQLLPVILPVPTGAEDPLLPLDPLEQLELTETPDPLRRFEPWEQPGLSEQPVSSHWGNSSHTEPTFAQESQPPWSPEFPVARGQPQSTHLLPPPHSHYPSETSQSWAGTPTASTVPSSQGSQWGGSEAPIRCDPCEKGFKSLKALQRHRSKAAVHQDEEDGVFICKCGSTTNRKDNFKTRHFKKCPKRHLHSALDVFTCVCGYQDASSSSMEQHFESCPIQAKPGRPNRSAPSPHRSLSNRLFSPRSLFPHRSTR